MLALVPAEPVARSWVHFAAEVVPPRPAAAPTLAVDQSVAARAAHPALGFAGPAVSLRETIAAPDYFPTSATVWRSSANQFRWPCPHQKSAGSARKAPAHERYGEQARRQSHC